MSWCCYCCRLRAGSISSIAVNLAYLLSVLISPYMPTVARTIWSQLGVSEDQHVLDSTFVRFLPEGHEIGKVTTLFFMFILCSALIIYADSEDFLFHYTNFVKHVTAERFMKFDMFVLCIKVVRKQQHKRHAVIKKLHLYDKYTEGCDLKSVNELLLPPVDIQAAVIYRIMGFAVF